jgi:hypothetical protein
MCKIVGLAVAAVIAASGSTWCTRSIEAANSEAVPATVRVLPIDILQWQLAVLLFK